MVEQGWNSSGRDVYLGLRVAESAELIATRCFVGLEPPSSMYLVSCHSSHSGILPHMLRMDVSNQSLGPTQICQSWASSEFLGPSSHLGGGGRESWLPTSYTPTSLKEQMNTCPSGYSRRIRSLGSLENISTDRDMVSWYVPGSGHRSFPVWQALIHVLMSTARPVSSLCTLISGLKNGWYQ